MWLDYEKDIFGEAVDGVEPAYFLYFVGEADTLLIHYSLLLITFQKSTFVFSEEWIVNR